MVVNKHFCLLYFYHAFLFFIRTKIQYLISQLLYLEINCFRIYLSTHSIYDRPFVFKINTCFIHYFISVYFQLLILRFRVCSSAVVNILSTLNIRLILLKTEVRQLFNILTSFIL